MRKDNYSWIAWRPVMLLVLIIGMCSPWLATPTLIAHAQDCLSALQVPGCSFGLPEGEYANLLGQMQANPAPAVTPITANNDEIGRYAYFKLIGDVITLYDAPEGNPIGEMKPGFAYTRLLDRQGDWVEVAPNTWIPITNIAAMQPSYLTGVTFGGGLPYPMAWIIYPIKPSAVPGWKPDNKTPTLYRYHRVYIYATVHTAGWDWYLIGPGQWVNQRQVAKVVPSAPPAGVDGRWIAVDLYEQVLTAYEGGQLVYATVISSGLNKWPTRLGTYKIYARFRQDSMTGAMGQPDYYHLPSVPYVMYFDDAISLHGTYWHDGFGFKHSHGCVNMSISDAGWIFNWTEGHDVTVYVWRSR